MQYQRIVHLSDTHLTACTNEVLCGHRPHRALALVLRELIKLTPQPEAIVVTGDMADSGSESEYTLFKEQLSPLGIPVYWLPGNHDDATAMTHATDGKLFSDEKSVALGAWQLILLNSQVIGQSHGHICSDEMAFLSTALSNNPNRPALVALHHTPCSPCVEPGCQLDNSKELLAQIQAHKNVKLVLAGHTHHAEKISLPGFDAFIAPSTFAQVIHPKDKTLLDAEDFFASHQLDGSRVGFYVFDLAADGGYLEQLHWVSVDQY